MLGAGRTEILETIFASNEGLRGGEIRLDGIAVDIRSPRDARRLGFALVTEDRKAKGLHLHESIRDNVALPLVGRLARFGLRSFGGERALAKGAVDALGVRCASTSMLISLLSGLPRVCTLRMPTRPLRSGRSTTI